MWSFLQREINAAQRHKDVEAGHPLTHEHGLHAFVFLSLIFAEAVKLIIEAWIEVRELRPEVVFLVAITILSVQYWWVIYESAFFYGKNIWNFAFGALEAALFYAVAYLLRHFQGLAWPFGVFGAAVVLFLVVDVFKYFEYIPAAQRRGLKRDISPRQLLRLAAIVVSFCGASRRLSDCKTAYTLLALAIVYTVWTSAARALTTDAVAANH
ncbi:MAG TPA: hypothetical protein VFO39_18630 [Candidatus Sulfotelmatobacter sp.]|nr:hypothetical protein [Candidatus Sulfotelmatobacter sp.]